jgi:hypothetical protein
LITILNSSLRGAKSRTLKFTEAFTKGLCKSLNMDYEVIHLAELSLQPCKGCIEYCMDMSSKHLGNCCIKDNFNEIKNKLFSSDIVIISMSHAGMGGICSLLKIFLERLCTPMFSYTMTHLEDGTYTYTPVAMPQKKPYCITFLGAGWNHDNSSDEIIQILRKSIDFLFKDFKSVTFEQFNLEDSDMIDVFYEAGLNYNASPFESLNSILTKKIFFEEAVKKLNMIVP